MLEKKAHGRENFHMIFLYEIMETLAWIAIESSRNSNPTPQWILTISSILDTSAPIVASSSQRDLTLWR